MVQQRRSIPSHQMTADVVLTGGVQAVFEVTTTPKPVRCGSANYSIRKSVSVYNPGPKDIYWGWNDGLLVANGTPIGRGVERWFSVSAYANLYLVLASGTQDVRITESG